MSKPPPPPNASIPRQTDIVIDPDGTVHFSFVWDELADCITALGGASAEFGEALTNTRGPMAGGASFEADTDDFGALEVSTKEYRSCQLCPKKCGFNRVRGVHPRCGDSALRVSTYGLTTGDEPVIRGPRGSGAIMLGGCSLRCPSCHNPEMVSGGEKISVHQLLDICFKLRDQGAANIQFLSPTVHFPVLKIALQALKRVKFDLPLVFKSSGYESLEQIVAFDGLVDIWLPDLKYGPDSAWAARAGVPDYFTQASQAIYKMIDQVGPLEVDHQGRAIRGVLVRHVLAPLPLEEKKAIDRFLDTLPVGVAVSRSTDFVDLER